MLIGRANFIVHRPTKDEIDYSYYLGNDYLTNYKPPKGKVPTYVSNHTSFFDTPSLICATKGLTCFVAGDFFKKLPCFGYIMNVMNCIFIPQVRNSDEIIDTIEKRMKAVEDIGSFETFVIYPEGCCSNNTCLMPFKKGPFVSLRQCHPVTLKYRGGHVIPSPYFCPEDLTILIYLCFW